MRKYSKNEKAKRKMKGGEVWSPKRQDKFTFTNGEGIVTEVNGNTLTVKINNNEYKNVKYTPESNYYVSRSNAYLTFETAPQGVTMNSTSSNYGFSTTEPTLNLDIIPVAHSAAPAAPAAPAPAAATPAAATPAAAPSAAAPVLGGRKRKSQKKGGKKQRKTNRRRR